MIRRAMPTLTWLIWVSWSRYSTQKREIFKGGWSADSKFTKRGGPTCYIRLCLALASEKFKNQPRLLIRTRTIHHVKKSWAILWDCPFFDSSHSFPFHFVSSFEDWPCFLTLQKLFLTGTPTSVVRSYVHVWCAPWSSGNSLTGWPLYSP